MKLYDRDPGCCEADLTACTAAAERPVKDLRGRKPARTHPHRLRSIQVHHVRGTRRFWHWLDQVPYLEEVPE